MSNKELIMLTIVLFTIGTYMLVSGVALTVSYTGIRIDPLSSVVIIIGLLINALGIILTYELIRDSIRRWKGYN